MYWVVLVFIVFVLGVFNIFKNNGSKNKDNKHDVSEKKVSVVIPAFNEEDSVGNIVRIAKNRPYVGEVIVVNDGSNDNTVNEAKFAGATVISHSKNRGKGAAIRTGFENSKRNIIAFIDGDIYNFQEDTLDKIINPILSGEADITKTKFQREGGRVTELTAKPLLNFFFPEIKFDQPLSGQFAGTKDSLKRIKFESDYGVDVGIVLDADVKGIKIKEVDIGEIKHDMSSLSDLNKMAGEVVRTIIDRAVSYGRVSMVDNLGKSIRMSILGLSLSSLGLFSIFFIKWIPVSIEILIAIIGLIIAIYYLYNVVKQSIRVIKKQGKSNWIRSFTYMHFPVLVSGIILVLLISTLVGAVNVGDGQLSVELSSRNLILWESGPNKTIDARGPYVIDSALEKEDNIIRMPESALSTLGLYYNDTIFIGGKSYKINTTREGEDDILRVPLDVRQTLKLNINSTISDSNFKNIFNDFSAVSYIVHNSSTLNSLSEGVFIENKINNAKKVKIKVDKETYETEGYFEGGKYSILINGYKYTTIQVNNNTTDETYYINYGSHDIYIYVNESTQSRKKFLNENQGYFLSFFFKEKPSS